MALRGFSLLLLSLAFAAEATRVLAISTLPYYPVHAGDKRVLFCRESVVREQVTERSSVGGYEAFRIVVPAPGRKDVIVVYAAQDAAGTAVVAVEYSRQVLLLDPPFLIPAEVTEGQRITLAGTIRHPLLGPVGTYDGLLIVESISETAATQAGTFEECLQVTYDLRAQIPAVGENVGLLRGRERRAAGAGTVWFQPLADGAQEPYVLLYASVGGQYYGRPGDINADGAVDRSDATLMAEAFLLSTSAYDPRTDLAPFSSDFPDIFPDLDGVTNEADLAAFIRLFSTRRQQ